MRIARLGQTDFGAIAAQIAALLNELAPGGGFDAGKLHPIVTEVLALNSVTGFLAWEEDDPVGVIVLNDCAAIYAGGCFGEITELYVVPGHRSRGVAGALVAQAVEEGRSRGWKRLEVGAPNQPDWARTLQFYLREGFAEVGPRLRRVL